MWFVREPDIVCVLVLLALWLARLLAPARPSLLVLVLVLALTAERPPRVLVLAA